MGAAVSCPSPSVRFPAAAAASGAPAVATAVPPVADVGRPDAAVAATTLTLGAGLQVSLAALQAVPWPAPVLPSASLPASPMGGGDFGAGARRCAAAFGGKRSRSRPVPVPGSGGGGGEDETPPSSPSSPPSPRGVAASALACLVEDDEAADGLAAPLWEASPLPASPWRCGSALATAAATPVGGGGGRPFTLGIAALGRKVRHPLMRAFLAALSNVLPAGRWVYLPVEAVEEAGGACPPPPVAEWPDVDILLAFHSPGFPLAAVTEYAAARQVPLVNSLADQFTLRDRSQVWAALVDAGVQTPDLVVRREAPTSAADAASGYGHAVPPMERYPAAAGRGVVTQDGEWLLVDGVRTLSKPFVEKPLDSDDHRCIVYHAGDGGASVIERKRVTHMPDQRAIRPTGSYVYERYHRAVAGADVKVYAAGDDVFFAETRTRTPAGAVVRAATPLSPWETNVARRVAAAFGQFLTGFDIIRTTDGKVLVIDVNGWSVAKAESGAFVKAAVAALGRRIRATLVGGPAAFAPPPRLAFAGRLPRQPWWGGGGGGGSRHHRRGAPPRSVCAPSTPRAPTAVCPGLAIRQSPGPVAARLRGPFPPSLLWPHPPASPAPPPLLPPSPPAFSSPR